MMPGRLAASRGRGAASPGSRAGGAAAVALAALALCALSLGCSKSPGGASAPAKDGEGGSAAPPAAGPAGDTGDAAAGTAPRPEPEPEPLPAPVDAGPDGFDDMLAQAEKLERETRFSEALKLCRGARKTYAKHPRVKELKRLMVRLTEERKVALNMPFAVEKLGSERIEEVMVAKDALAGAGEVGRLFLRNAVRDREGPVAAEAAKLLAEVRDDEAAAFMLARLREDPKDPPRAALLASMKRLFAAGKGLDVLPALDGLTKGDAEYAFRDVAGVLCSAFEKTAGGDPAKYGELVGDPGGHERLKAYVERAMDSGDEALAAWASEHAAVAGFRVRGLRGSYYHGTEFEKLVFEKLDAKIQIPDQEFPYPDGRQENLSVRWTGFVRVATRGRYTFYSAADDGQRLWVDGKQLVDDWSMHGVQEKSGTIDLAPGFHEFRVDFMQGGGNAEITVSWEGPGIRKQVITDENLFTLPWPGMGGK